jgi:hypothetical protein
MLLQHTSASLQMYLNQLLQVWLELGQLPHTFGQLWLEAPEALLRWSLASHPTNEFQKHLDLLQVQLQAGPIAEILLASTSLSGFLLSLPRPAAGLSGCVHRAAGYLLIAPGVQDLCVLREKLSSGSTDSIASESDRTVLAVYGVCCDPQCRDHWPAAGAEGSHSIPGSSTSPTSNDTPNSSGSSSSSTSSTTEASSSLCLPGIDQMSAWPRRPDSQKAWEIKQKAATVLKAAKGLAVVSAQLPTGASQLHQPVDLQVAGAEQHRASSRSHPSEICHAGGESIAAASSKQFLMHLDELPSTCLRLVPVLISHPNMHA